MRPYLPPTFALLFAACSSAPAATPSAPVGPSASSTSSAPVSSTGSPPPGAPAAGALPSASAVPPSGSAVPSGADTAQAPPTSSAPASPPGPAKVEWVVEPVDNTDWYKLGVVPGGPVVVLGDNQVFVTSTDDMFIEALSPDGEVLWHKTGTAKWTRALSITKEHAFLGTEFSGTLDFQGVRAHAPHTASLVAKLDSQGALRWGHVLESGDYTRMQALVATPDGGVAVGVGIFAAAKKGPLAVKVAGGQDAVVVKYDAAGEVAWTKTFSWTGYDEISGMFATADGGALVSGTRWKSPDSWASSLADGRCHGFLLRLGPNGEERWSTDLGADTMRVTVTRSAAGPDGVVVSGAVRFRNRFGNIELDGGPKDQGYLAGLDASGQVVWARLHKVPECLTIDKANRMIQVGLDGVTVETASGESTTLLSFEKGALTRITDCQLDDSGHLYVAGSATPGATIGGVAQPGPRIKRKGTSWLHAYEVGFVAKLKL